MIGCRKVFIARGATLVLAATLALTIACTQELSMKDTAAVRQFATDYAVDWGSQDPAKVAARFAPTATLAINDGAPTVGREAIAARAKQFMTEFPDLGLRMDELSIFRGDITFHWTLTGKNTGPGGTGRAIKVSGYDEWTLAPDGLIATSKSYYDEADYQRQLTAPAPAPRGR